MIVHNLKTWPDQFAGIRDGIKTFEYRKDDRNFQKGDRLRLQEFIPDMEAGEGHGNYTGEEITVQVIDVLKAGFDLPPGHCIMSIAIMDADSTTPTTPPPPPAVPTPPPDRFLDAGVAAEVLAAFRRQSGSHVHGHDLLLRKAKGAWLNALDAHSNARRGEDGPLRYIMDALQDAFRLGEQSARQQQCEAGEGR